MLPANASPCRISIGISAILFLSLIANSVAGCCSSQTSQKAEDTYGPGTYTITGTTHYVNIETGCWQFTADDGKHYELGSGKTDELLRDGARATIVVRDAVGKASTCMVGKIVEVIKVINVTH